ncbi:MAG: hypothetical protein H6721_32010 [Sandaracinus sp.]|nr:hypothetical protein [Sandaracinus sp.]
MVDTATFFARRVGGDGEIGVFSYQRMPGGSWRRSPLDLSGGTLGPAYAGGLVLMGQLQPDDSEDAVVRVLGCP